ncbi:MAG: hypothetical protein SA339_02465 [Methanomassiliicoccus sp.]|nr:hypothetical protein [Methanomassiliicoccus sp.]
MKTSWLVIGAILVIIASAILIANVGYTYTLISGWFMLAIIGTLYGIGAMMIVGAFLMPSPPRTAVK